MSDDLWRWSASRLAGAVRDKSVSSREIIQSHLSRIDTVNCSINAITVVLAENALLAADAADASIAAGDDVGLLHGVPITVKENIDVAGSATTQGVVNLRNSVPEYDAPVVRFLKEAGAIIIGRTNMPDYAMRWHTDNDLYGATLNPWDPLRTPGGSSGGEAAAIATGMSPLGIGNDMGGSTRQPAINCGITGLRPSTGRVSRVMSRINEAPPAFYEQVAAVNGPMARNVADLRLALDVMGQPDPSDPIWVPAVAPATSEESEKCVGLVRDPSGDGIADAIDKALDRAAEILQQAGYTVDEIEPPLISEVDDVIQKLSQTEVARYIDDILPVVSDDAAKVLKAVLGEGSPGVETYRDAIAERYRIAETWSLLMSRFPLILGPVSSMEAFPVGHDVSDPETMRALNRSFRMTELCNLIGLPSIALPVAVTGGMPQGVQIIGRRFDESRCFDAAEVIERVVQIVTPIDPVVT